MHNPKNSKDYFSVCVSLAPQNRRGRNRNYRVAWSVDPAWDPKDNVKSSTSGCAFAVIESGLGQVWYVYGKQAARACGIRT